MLRLRLLCATFVATRTSCRSPARALERCPPMEGALWGVSLIWGESSWTSAEQRAEAMVKTRAPCGYVDTFGAPLDDARLQRAFEPCQKI